MSRRKIIGILLLVPSLLFFAFTLLMIGFKVTEPLSNDKWFLDMEHKKPNVTDFFQYYQAAQLATSEKSRAVYDPQVQLDWMNNLIQPLHTDKIFYNQQPPFSYPLLAPLATMPVTIAYPVWCIAQLSFGLLALAFLTKLGPLSARDRNLFLLGVMASFPAYICLWHGNTTFWLLGFLAFYAYFLCTRRDIPAGAMLALSTFKPQYFFPMVIPIFGMRRWKVLTALIVSESILMLAAVLTIGWENVIGYPKVLAIAESSPKFIGVNPHMMISLRGMFAQFLTVKQSLQATAAIMFASLIPLFVMWWKSGKNPPEERLRWAWAVTATVAVLVSPHAHTFDFLLITIACALTLPSLSVADKLTPGFWYRVWCSVFLLFPMMGWIANYSLGIETAPIAFFFPCVLVLAATAVLNFRAKALSEANSSQIISNSESAS
ncbi:MAG: DUF2029 domain-containing protein [Cyanobacteria bacterium]|nr:DUF2029 domain-containing protein [Cyanobacteriota bacterium]